MTITALVNYVRELQDFVRVVATPVGSPPGRQEFDIAPEDVLNFKLVDILETAGADGTYTITPVAKDELSQANIREKKGGRQRVPSVTLTLKPGNGHTAAMQVSTNVSEARDALAIEEVELKKMRLKIERMKLDRELEAMTAPKGNDNNSALVSLVEKLISRMDNNNKGGDGTSVILQSMLESSQRREESLLRLIMTRDPISDFAKLAPLLQGGGNSNNLFSAVREVVGIARELAPGGGEGGEFTAIANAFTALRDMNSDTPAPPRTPPQQYNNPPMRQQLPPQRPQVVNAEPVVNTPAPQVATTIPTTNINIPTPMDENEIHNTKVQRVTMWLSAMIKEMDINSSVTGISQIVYERLQACDEEFRNIILTHPFPDLPNALNKLICETYGVPQLAAYVEARLRNPLKLRWAAQLINELREIHEEGEEEEEVFPEGEDLVNEDSQI